MTADDFARQLRLDYLASKLERARKPRPITSNHPHSAGHPCDRYLVLLRVAWRLQTPMSDPIKAALFEEGHHQERALVEDLNALTGYVVVLQKFPVALADLDMVGEIDFFLQSPSPFRYVADAKAVSTGIFKSLNTWEDVVRHRRYFVRNWRDQLLLYLEGARRDWAMWAMRQKIYFDASLLLLKDKVTGDIKAIPIPWDRKWWQATVHRFARLNELVGSAMAAGGQDVAPDDGSAFSLEALGRLRKLIPPVVATEHRNDVCPGCSFFAFCCSELRFPVGHAEVLDDADLEAWLERRHQLCPAHEDYDEADAESKALLKRYKVTLGPDGKAYWLIGSFLITVRKISPRNRPSYFAYDVWRRPDPPKEQA